MWGTETTGEMKAKVWALEAKWCSVLEMVEVQRYSETGGKGRGLSWEVVLGYVLSHPSSILFESFHCFMFYSNGYLTCVSVSAYSLSVSSALAT